MSFWDVRRSIVSAQILIDLAGRHGVAAAECLRDTGIAAPALTDPQTEISAGQELALVRNLVRLLGDVPGIGLDAGLSYHLSAYGIWGFALLSSPTFGAAAQVAVRYLDLSYAFVRFDVQRHAGQARLLLDDGDIEPPLRTFLVERDFAAIVNACRELLPSGLRFQRLQFRCAPPPHAARYRELFGVDAEFDALDNAVWMDEAYLDAPLPQANPDMARLGEAQCRQLLARRRVRSGVAGRVRDRLLRSPAAMPGIDTVAADLLIAPRSLRRRLDDEGTSFRALVDEVRQTLAEELLTTANLKLDEVAARLGYAEAASFIRAFQRWKGQSPAAFRRQHRAAPTRAGDTPIA